MQIYPIDILKANNMPYQDVLRIIADQARVLKLKITIADFVFRFEGKFRSILEDKAVKKMTKIFKRSARRFPAEYSFSLSFPPVWSDLSSGFRLPLPLPSPSGSTHKESMTFGINPQPH